MLLSESKDRYLETEKKYIVYSAELCGIYEALKAISNILQDSPHQILRIFYIFTDN